MVNYDPWQILQLIGLSLPFLALYLGVLVEIHKIPKPIKGAELTSPDGDSWLPPGTMYEESEWVGSVTITYAYQHWDFVFALLSTILVLVAGISLILSLIFDYSILLSIGFCSVILSYVSISISIIFTILFCAKNFSPSE